MTEYSIDSLETLTALYGEVNVNSLAKETPSLTSQYRAWIEAAPFFAMASVGSEGLDCSPRGDVPGQVFAVLDDRTLVIPDRRGNNRLDTLKNIVRDPRVALLFLNPGINETLRINGRARLSQDPAQIARFEMDGKLPKLVIVVEIDAVYFQCARALKRAKLWDMETQRARGDVPSAGQMTKGASPDFDAESYDDALQERQGSSLY